MWILWQTRHLVVIKKIFPLLSLLILAGCLGTERRSDPSGGVALSFDDHFIREWYQLRPLFNRYKARVTFFVTCPDTLSAEDAALLRQLQSDGHEIGFHGTIHGSARQLLQSSGVKGYLETEINPGLTYLHQAGLYPTSYAHPGGNQTTPTDEALLARGFVLLRDVAKSERKLYGLPLYHIPPQFMPSVYYRSNQDQQVKALLIDTDANLSKTELTQALITAKKTGTVLMLFGHKPLFGEPGPEEYGFDVDMLKHILKEADSLRLHFYRMSELPRL